MLKKRQIKIAGLLLLLTNIGIFMGIIISEMFYPNNYTTRNSPICALAGTKPPNIIIKQPSATIFNTTMIVAGIAYLISSFLIYRVFKKHIIAALLGLIGIGLLGAGLFPVTFFDLHYAFSVLIFISSQVFVVVLYRFVRTPLRYVFLCIGLASLSCDFVFGNLLTTVFGKGGAERLIIYPILFSIIGFGAYLLGCVHRVKSDKKVKQY